LGFLGEVWGRRGGVRHRFGRVKRKMGEQRPSANFKKGHRIIVGRRNNSIAAQRRECEVKGYLEGWLSNGQDHREKIRRNETSGKEERG